MSYIKPTFVHPQAPRNEVGYLKRDYEGKISTLCAGCGHDSISAAIVQACFEMNIEPHHLAKLSGIGCSSKTPTYFLSNSHGFNSVHGRMPSIATGANLANKELIYLGVSGDGDTASIGMGQFVHVIRRNVNMTYIVMNNGCYGLTKGQDSATADKGSISKPSREATPYEAIDLVGLALELNASFVARSFSGDKSQLIPLLKAAMSHKGFAFIDIISPCVTFNNNKGSTKSYDYVREHISITGAMDYVPEEKAIEVEYAEGSQKDIELFGHSVVHLEKLAPNWNPTDKQSAIDKLQATKRNGQILTGLLYVNPNPRDLHQINHTVDIPLNKLTENHLYPGDGELDKINEGMR
ncbi:MAG: 2-oxoacid:ferredoxin oxidoreductase subunit beta [Bacteroidia bacterium]|nr:2-oxoacid:ferredoxin oxidoreductase subunit beta [Bacteroidia bacterium]